MTIHHRTKYRTHMLNEAVVAQQIIRAMQGCSETFLEEHFEDLRVDSKTNTPRWIESYQKTIQWVLTAGLGAAFFPIGIQLLFLAPELTLIGAFIISFTAKGLSSIFKWAVERAITPDAQVNNYIRSLRQKGQLSDKNACVDTVEDLLNQGGILARLMKYFRSSAEISIPAISFLVAGAVTLGIASLSFLGLIIHLSPVLTSVVAITSGLCFISGLILWPRASYKNSDSGFSRALRSESFSGDQPSDTISSRFQNVKSLIKQEHKQGLWGGQEDEDRGLYLDLS